MKKKPTDMGTNRTGIKASPIDAKRSIEGAIAGSPPAVFETPEIDHVRRTYSKEARPLGSMPPPASLKGLGKTVMDTMKGEKTTVLLDKLAERMAFERGGTRLYELLLIKFDAANPHPGGPTRAELEEIRNDELRHFGMLAAALQELGADPTSMTPGANCVGVTNMGLMQLLADPRTTLTQGLEAVHIAELVDNDCWDTLIELTDAMGKRDLVDAMRTARDEEREHLAKVRRWLAVSVMGQAGVGDEAEAAASAPPP